MVVAPRPPIGASMLVVREPYTSLILNGSKTHELRGNRICGLKYLACSTSHKVKALVYFGDARILDDKEYEATFHEHRCEDAKKRYKKTWSTRILRVIPLCEDLRYRAKPGAIGYARYYGSDWNPVNASYMNLLTCERHSHQSNIFCIVAKPKACQIMSGVHFILVFTF